MTWDKRFKTLFMSIPDGFYLSETLYDDLGNPCDYRYLEVNPKFAQLIGLSREEIIGKRYRELVPIDTTRWLEAYCSVDSTGIPMTFEFYSAEYQMYFETYSYQPDKGQVAVFVRDITERKQTESALRKSEEKIRALFNASSDAIIIADTNGLILETNKAAEEIFGYSNEGIVHSHLTDLMPERYRAAHLHGLERATSIGKTTYLNRVLEFHGINKDGVEFPLELNVATWFVDKEQYFSGIIRDISARKKAEADLRESEKKLNIIFNSTNDGILVADAENRKFVTGNRAICKMLGYSPEELIGLCVDDIHPVESLQEVHSQYERQLRKEIDVYHNAPVMRKDKSVFFADISATPTEFGGKAWMIGLFRDVTERIRMEERVRQSQKMEAIGTLAGGIAHDFNNLLSPIIGYTELVMDSLPRGTEEASLLIEVKEASIRARELVQQILAFSRKGTEEKKPLKIQLIIKEALKLLRSSIPSSIEIREDIDDKCGPVMCDPTNIHQIMMNLCTNAYHAMMQDGGVLEVSLNSITVRQEDTQLVGELPVGTYIRLIVRDTGHGMDKSTVRRIFEPYFTTKEKGEGTGLGLPLVHTIVENHNGKIKVYSSPEEGATFTIYLPQIIFPQEDIEVQKEETLPSGTEHILLVDDEKSIVAMFTRVLEALGYQVTGLTDSIEALECFREDAGQFDLVITDQTMPHLSGYELAKRMLEINPGIPIILCTGFSSIISKEKSESLGIKKMLMKPIMKSEMAKVIRSVLGACE